MSKFKLILIAVVCLMTMASTPVSAYAGGGMTGEGSGEGSGEGLEPGGDGGTGGEGTNPTSNIQPKKLVIQSVTPSPAQIEPGQPFTLTFDIANRSYSKMEGVSLKIVSVEGKQTLEGFTPVGTTNEVFLGTIPSGKTSEITINMMSDPAIKNGIHNFYVSVTYNAPKQDQEEILKTFGIMIKGKPSVDLSDVQVYPDPMSGVLVSGGVKNESSFKIKSTEVIVNLDGVDYNAHIGSVDAASDSYFEVVLPSVEKEKDATVSVKFLDETNTEHVKTIDVKIPASPTIDPVGPGTGPGDVIAPEESGGFWSWIKGLFGFGA